MLAWALQLAARIKLQSMLRFPTAQNNQNGSEALHTSRAQGVVLAVLVLMAYLSLVNLDYAPFWDDEAIAPTMARNLLSSGSPTADDGRNVLSYQDGKDIRPDLTYRYPTAGIYLQAAMFGLFGVGEVQARTLMALLSLAAMLLFADVLRREFSGRWGFIALAMTFACLSPITLGYARCATYNSPLLLFNILLFWSYLRYCECLRVRFALLAAAAAVAGYYTHPLGSGVFIAALGIFHLLFRHSCFDLRAWLISISMISVYGLMVVWFFHVEYSTGGYAGFGNKLSFENAWWRISAHIAGLNRNLILVWPVALWLVLHCGYRMLFASAAASGGATGSRWRALREDRVFQYFVFVVAAAIILALTTPQPIKDRLADIRYLTPVVPFAAVVAAAAVSWTWRRFRPAGWLAGAVLLLSNLGGWPFLDHRYYGNSPLPTLPALAVEYHYDYPGPSGAAFAYLREHVPQDDIVWVAVDPPSRIMYYLSDRALICCNLRKDSVPEALQGDKRSYLFQENINDGTVRPDWVLFFGDAPETHLIKYGSWHYRLEKEIPGTFVAYRDPQHPEPDWHAAFPLEDFGAKHRIRFYRVVQGSELQEILRQVIPAS